MSSAAPRSAPALSIGQLSRRAGVNIETIRYYERIQILPAPPRTAGGRRGVWAGRNAELDLHSPFAGAWV